MICISIGMPSKIPDDVKRNVIREYLKGTGRFDNASVNGLSEGGVNNIISEWKISLGEPTADSLRELAVSLRKLEITAPECASGFRVAKILQKLGVAEENYLSFISDIFNQCMQKGLNTDQITNYMQQLIELCQSVPVSHISQHLEQKRSDKMQLEQEILRLRKEEVTTRSEVEKARRERDSLMADLNSIQEAKNELQKAGASVHDISRLARASQGFRKLNYNVERVVGMLANLDSACGMESALEDQIKSSRSIVADLKLEHGYLEDVVKSLRIKAEIYEELEDMGLGIYRLRILHDTIREVASECKITEKAAAENLFADITKNYDRKIGYQAEIDKMINELNFLRKLLSYDMEVYRALSKLISMGYKDKDILNLASILQTNCTQEASFVNDLKMYGKLRQAIDQLKVEERQLKANQNNIQLAGNQIQDVVLAWIAVNLYLTAEKVKAGFRRQGQFCGFRPLD